MVASVGSVGIIRSVSSFESSAVENPVSAASRERVSRFWVRSVRNFCPRQYGSRDHCAYESDFEMAVSLRDPQIVFDQVCQSQASVFLVKP
jgi:hypothetical protein